MRSLIRAFPALDLQEPARFVHFEILRLYQASVGEQQSAVCALCDELAAHDVDEVLGFVHGWVSKVNKTSPAKVRLSVLVKRCRSWFITSRSFLWLPVVRSYRVHLIFQSVFIALVSGSPGQSWAMAPVLFVFQFQKRQKGPSRALYSPIRRLSRIFATVIFDNTNVKRFLNALRACSSTSWKFR